MTEQFTIEVSDEQAGQIRKAAIIAGVATDEFLFNAAIGRLQAAERALYQVHGVDLSSVELAEAKEIHNKIEGEIENGSLG